MKNKFLFAITLLAAKIFLRATEPNLVTGAERAEEETKKSTTRKETTRKNRALSDSAQFSPSWEPPIWPSWGETTEILKEDRQ